MSEEIKNLQEELNDQMLVRREKMEKFFQNLKQMREKLSSMKMLKIAGEELIHSANGLLLKIMQKILKMTS